MPSPFPGMDPYLEVATEWSSFHSALIAEIARQLNVGLPPNYAARIEAQIYVVPADERYSPDVTVYESPRPQSRGGTALAEKPQVREPEIIPALEEERTVRFVQIIRMKPAREIVAVIELLSPANKRAYSKGRETYERKQQRILSSDAHFLEIDLLREGEYTISAPQSNVREAGTFDYLISLSQSDYRANFYVWRLQLSETLPCFALPLWDKEEVIIDLQAAFNSCYESGRYRQELDYTVSPEPPFTPEQEIWANALLVAQGLRS